LGNPVNYSYIIATVLLTVYGQIVIKWQVINAGNFPLQISERIAYLMNLLINPWILSAFFAAFLAVVSWMIAMTKFELSHALSMAE
jgi:hypothetical protein